MEKYFHNTKYLILNALIFLFPLFFLTNTQEFFITNKFYLLVFGALLLLLITSIQILVTKKIVWQKSSFDNLLILFLVAVGVSTVIISPNKIQALLNPNFGLVAILALVILYFYLSREKNFHLESNIYHLISIIVSIVAIIFFFDPFKNANLPQTLQFLKTANFTPLGSRLDLAIFLGFFVTLGLGKIISKEKKLALNLFVWFINFVALFLTIFTLVRPASSIQLPPFKLSWFAAVEILKNPLTAFFGVGVDNFSAIFTQVKDVLYNQSVNWQIGSFSVSRSAVLHVFTETGVLGLLTFGLILFSLIKATLLRSSSSAGQTIKFVICYLLFVILFFPPSLVTWFLLILVITEISKINDQPSNIQSFDFSNLMPVYLGLGIFSIIIVVFSGYFLGRSYLAEAAFKKSIDGYLTNNGKLVYDNQRQAIIFNPYIERFRTNFSQTNLLIANNIASKAKDNKLSEQNRQTITQAIQAAISEAKAAVSLNSQKASNWENLAVIYRNVINVAQGADLWTISAYQRAIVTDPQNPNYRLGLGGVHYSLGNWDEAGKLFEQAVSLKPNWPNAYYNLAWANYQKKDYPKAVNALENALKLIDPTKDKADYDRAKTELDEFKTKLPKEENQTPTTNNESPSQLALPTPIPTTEQPKIQLPKEASPEAR